VIIINIYKYISFTYYRKREEL